MLYQVIRTFISGAYEHKKTYIIERIPHIKPAFAVPSGGRLNNGLLLLFCPSLTLLQFYHRFYCCQEKIMKILWNLKIYFKIEIKFYI